MRRIVFAVALGVLAACSDPGNRPPGVRAPDQKSWQAAQDPYLAPGWTSGDERSWEEQMRRRAQGQNEYARIAGGGTEQLK